MNLVVLLGYLYGTPVLYGVEIRPTSLPSGVMFIFLGAGLIAASGPDHLPLRLLAGPSVRALLLRNFLMVIFVFALIHAVIYNLFSQLILNVALRTALSVLISVVVTGIVVSQLSRTIGSAIDRANAERSRAEEALQRAYDELEIRVQERTAELAKTNEALRRERDKAQKYLDVAGVMVVVIDAEKKVILVNRKCCEILGYNKHEIIGKNWFENFLPERVRYEVEIVFTKLMAGEIEPVEFFENPVLTRSGEERMIAWHNTVLRDEAGNITSVLSVV